MSHEDEVREFLRLSREAHKALDALQEHWTKLYGPSEALVDAHQSVAALADELAGGEDGWVR